MEGNLIPTQASRVEDAKNQAFNWFVQKIRSTFTDEEISTLQGKQWEELSELNVALSDFYHGGETKALWHKMIDEVADAFTCVACGIILYPTDTSAKDELYSLFYVNVGRVPNIMKAAMLYAPYKWFSCSPDSAESPRFDVLQPSREVVTVVAQDADHVSLTEVLDAYKTPPKVARSGKLLIRIEVSEDELMVTEISDEDGVSL